MPLVLEVLSGPSAGKKIEVPPGQTVRVGRVDPAQARIGHDTLMSNVHFAVSFDGHSARLEDLKSRFGTKVNGKLVGEGLLQDGDRVLAGQTTFVVRLAPEGAATKIPSASGSAAAPTAAPGPSVPGRALTAGSEQGRLLELLREGVERLFALLDAAREPLVLARLFEAKPEFQSLYEGTKGDALAAFAPYLVALPPGSLLLETLVRDGWGKSWGVYLRSGLPFKELRQHFRRFLLVKTEAGEELYFRFYDPRVLRVFLPTCSPQEAAQFFGPVTEFLLESGDPGTLLTFKLKNGRAEQQMVSLRA